MYQTHACMHAMHTHTHTHTRTRTHTHFIAVLCIGEVKRKCVLYIHIVHPAAHFKAANLICVCYTYICRKRSAVLADHGPVDHGSCER